MLLLYPWAIFVWVSCYHSIQDVTTDKNICKYGFKKQKKSRIIDTCYLVLDVSLFSYSDLNAKRFESSKQHIPAFFILTSSFQFFLLCHSAFIISLSK